MANSSPFLTYQDKNGDFLIDDCEVDLPGPIEKVCLDCKPNPKAIVQNWKTSLNTPFFNEKLCLYQVGVKTSHTDTGGDDGIVDRFETYKEEAIELFLDEYQKANNFENIEALRKGITYDPLKDFELEARANSVLSLLYSVPFDVIQNLENADEDNDDEEREPIEVTYLASELPILFTRVRKGLALYSRYTKVESVMQGASLVFDESRSVFNIDKYGDTGFGRSGEMAKVFIELDRFLNRRGFNIAGAGTFGFAKDRVVKLKISFNLEFKVKKLTVFSVGCREKPKVFKGRRLAALNRIEVFKDPTAMAYFAQLADMEKDLTARNPKKFVEFIQDYTFPTVAFLDAEQILEGDTSCVADTIRNSVQGLGQDLLDEVLGIGDILAYQFHKNICRPEDDEDRLREQFGQLYRPIEELALFGNKKKGGKKESIFSKGSMGAVKAMATQQAYEKLQANPNVFVQLCGDILVAGTPLSGALTARNMWDASFDRLKLCGLLDFLLDALGCLWGGLELEEALTIAITSALKAMGIENFGKLFVGLPPEEQAELDTLVKRKLAEAKESGSTTQTAAQDEERNTVDADASPLPWRNAAIKKPFEDPVLIEQERASRTAGPYEGTTVSSGVYEAQSANFGVRPRLGTTYNNQEEISGNQTPASDAIQSLEKRAQQTFSPDAIMEAYILALVEYYSGRLLDLVDKLNEFPGAEIISKVLAVVDCPRPPLFTPSIMDFLKDIELPFCRNVADIALPKLFIPKINFQEIIRRILEAIKEAIIQAVIQILIRLMVKICEILGEAICKALETAGNIIGQLPGLLSGNTTVKDIVREAICGPGATSEQVDDSIASMFKNLGGAGANLANRDRVLEFNEAIASASTRQEIIDASLGNPSQQFLSIVDTIIDVQFPDFREAMPNQSAISSFFSNFGNLLPPEIKSQLDNIANETYENLGLPANPTLCATPDQIDEFCSLRAQILEGRASDEQIAILCTRPTDDFETLNNVLQDGIPATIMNNLPPLMSDPGCSNGLFPYEPEELQQAASAGLSADLDNLKTAYSYDMLGNGPGEKNWGYINMILCDTMARPFTNHARLVNRFAIFGAKKYVDFYVDNQGSQDGVEEVNYANISRQRGAFPVYVGEWQNTYWEINSGDLVVNQPSNTLTRREETFFESNDDITELPDFGYNIGIKPATNGYNIITRRRKAVPDLSMTYRDNRGGNGDGSGTDESMTFGNRLEFYFSDFRSGVNIKESNVRVKITELQNDGNNSVDVNDTIEQQNSVGQENAPAKPESSSAITENEKFEFIGIDSGVDELIEAVRRDSGDQTRFANFESAFEQKSAESPLVLLTSDILRIEEPAARSYWQNTVQKLASEFGNRVFTNSNPSFLYGAKPDTLTTELSEYGVEQNGEWKKYSEATFEDADGIPQPLRNRDGVMGMSYDEYINGDDARVFYLDPAKFGGTYTNPKVYVKPTDTEGILGLVNVMFPELSPCKPYKTDLVDFADIASKISTSYNNYPDDPRLAGDPDCIVERPFDRVLGRASKAGIEGTISAACRIYASMHFLKTINTFAMFKPDFNTNLSSVYASFILEDMEKNMKEQQGLFAERLNPFKDDEFWYAFLEQSVQTYFNKVQSGSIIDIPADVERALERIAAAQNRYNYPDRKDLKNAKKIGEAPRLQGLTQYREDQNLAAVKSVEDDCKIVLKEFMIEEVNFISKVFYKNMVEEKFIDKDNYVTNIHYHILSELTDGSQLTLNKELRETVANIPTGSGQYTDGNTLALEDGTPYVGYYHTHIDDEGDLVFMVGEQHTEEDHESLRPFANEVKVNMGDIDGVSVDPTKPFKIRKYIRRNLGPPETYSQALLDSIKEEGGDSLVSEIYPGTLEYVYDAGTVESQNRRVREAVREARERGETLTREEIEAERAGVGRRIVGLKGELGLRYGLEFSTSTGQVIARSEIDVLDLPLRMLKPLEGGSKELLCLVNKLIDDPRYKLFMEYAIPTKQILAAIAIYNDTSYLTSIGEIVSGAKRSGQIGDKPGMVIDGSESAPGWLPKSERGGFSPFVLTWDEWSKETLRKSDTVLKKMFKSYYYSREFGRQDKPDATGAQIALQNLKEKFKFAPGDRTVPWWNRRASNPFNANGQLCERKEDD